MKTILFILFIFLSGGSLFSQNKDTTEVKIDSVTYMKYQYRGRVFIYNKVTELRHLPNSYDEHSYPVEIKISDKNIIFDLLKKHLTPFFKKNGIPTDINVKSIRFVFFSDLNGDIKDIDFSYPAESNIPMRIIYQLDQDLRKSNLKLLFDKNSRRLKGASWVGRIYDCPCEKIRDL